MPSTYRPRRPGTSPHGLWKAIVALPPPPDPPFDITTIEPIETPPHAIWRADFEEFGPDRWTEIDPACKFKGRTIYLTSF